MRYAEVPVGGVPEGERAVGAVLDYALHGAGHQPRAAAEGADVGGGERFVRFFVAELFCALCEEKSGRCAERAERVGEKSANFTAVCVWSVCQKVCTFAKSNL